MSTGSISEASLKYFEEKHIKALLDEAMRDVLVAMPADPLEFLEEAFRRPTPLRLVIAGLPGCGKGTHCALLAEKYGIKPISPGDLLRNAAENGDADDEATRRIAKHVIEGSLVPDELFVELVLKEVRQAEANGTGWVLDGFPRTRAQAISLQTAGISPQRFFLLDIPESVSAARSLGRVSAGTSTYAKVDDTPNAVKTRLEYFNARKDELLDCYRPFFVRIDGNRDLEAVSAELYAQCDAIDLAK